MTQTENTSSEKLPESGNDAIFSDTTRNQALLILSNEHGWLIRAFWAPVRDFIDWILHKQASSENASNVIEARIRFNRAANDSIKSGSEESNKAA